MLVLHNGNSYEELAGDLEVMKLDDKSIPPWEALSYAWGTSTTYSRIKIGERFIKISANLGDALRRLRCRSGAKAPEPGRRLWVDQICINQEDIPERSQQVQLMYSIYEKAKDVNVWLGPDRFGTAKRAFFSLHLLVSLSTVQQLMLRDDDSGALEPIYRDLEVLFDQPWFSRLWIIQEVGTMTPATVFWGQECIDFFTLYKASCVISNDLFRVASYLSGRVSLARSLYQSFVEGRKRLTRMEKDFAFQLYWFNMGSDRLCLDPRDRVFSLLGHYSALIGPDRRPIMRADYSLTKTDVYQEIAIRALTDTKSTFILNAVQHFDQIRVPSWIPDWGDSKTHHVVFHRPHFDWMGVATNHPLVARVLKPQNMLEIRGFVFDTVDISAQAFNRDGTCWKANYWDQYPYRTYPSRTWDETHILEKIWDDICGHDIFDFLAEYHAIGSSALVAFLDTCTGGWNPPFYFAEPGGCSSAMIPADEAFNGVSYLSRVVPPGRIDVSDIPEGKDDADFWQALFFRAVNHRRFAKTAGGYYALCPELTEEGDLVVVFMGYQTPFILRPTGDEFLLVGECYVHGIMQGQALTRLENGEAVLRDFNIL
ncbi:HET-domain-containing protein [Apiospora arundinis]|uniref:HET-domain-containing protein n=1 Tax=Apiospora arundinis TaxID=335852 RepID=A0ABR2HPH6_9PEZI